jgi:hypothetical protein
MASASAGADVGDHAVIFDGLKAHMLDDTYNRTAKRMRHWGYSAFRIKFSASDLRQLDFDYTVKSRLTLALYHRN